MDINILEKDRVYKIRHSDMARCDRDYILCSPRCDVDITNLPKLTYSHEKFINFSCHFIVSFIGEILTSFDNSRTGYFEDCTLLPLTSKDLAEVRLAMEKLGGKYNRKLNRVIVNA